jgi:hypothetical protein
MIVGTVANPHATVRALWLDIGIRCRGSPRHGLRFAVFAWQTSFDVYAAAGV